MEQLTPKQQEFYDVLIDYVRTHFRWPTYRELADLLGMNSENSITQYYKILADKKYLKKDNQNKYTFTRPDDVWASTRSAAKTVPVIGEIAAGDMGEAFEADLGMLTINDFFPKADNIFALRIRGLSMKELGLSTGDLVILSKSDLQDGEIGAVLYQGETTLKRAYHKSNGLRLEPANPDYDDIIIEPGEFEQVTVIGKYLGHINEKELVTSCYADRCISGPTDNKLPAGSSIPISCKTAT